MNSRQIANTLGHLDLAAKDRENAERRLVTLLDHLHPRMISGQIIIRQEIEKDLNAVRVRIEHARKILEEAAALKRLYEADHSGQDAKDSLAETTDEP